MLTKFHENQGPVRSHRGVGDKPMSCKPGVAGSIPVCRMRL